MLSRLQIRDTVTCPPIDINGSNSTPTLLLLPVKVLAISDNSAHFLYFSVKALYNLAIGATYS